MKQGTDLKVQTDTQALPGILVDMNRHDTWQYNEY